MVEIQTIPLEYADILKDPQQVTLFGKEDCLRTRKAKAILEKINLEYVYVDVDALLLSEDQILELNILSGFVEFPKLFIGKICIGGLKELLSAKHKQQFSELLDSNHIVHDKDALINYSECCIF